MSYLESSGNWGIWLFVEIDVQIKTGQIAIKLPEWEH